MSRHKAAFGGFPSRSAAREELAGYEDAPGAGGNQPEGNKTNSEGKDPVTRVPRSDVDQFAQEIGATLIHELDERGLSLDWLADEAKIGDVQAVSDAILGTQHTGLISTIAEALSLTPSELVRNGDITEFRKTDTFRQLLAEYEAVVAAQGDKR